MKQNIGVVGLGVMGRAMAANLANGTDKVTGFDVSETTRAAVAGAIDVTETLEDLAGIANLILLSLPGPDACYSVLNIICAHAVPGTLVIDTSTVDPQTTRDLADRAAASGLLFVAAPVIGGQKGAQSGALTVIAGGSHEALEQAKEALQRIGSDIHFVASPPAAATLKLLNNMMSLGNTVVFAEALALAAQADVPASVVHDVLRNGSGASVAFDRRFAVNIGPEHFEPGFSVDLAVKDLRLVQGFAAGAGLMLPAAEQTLATFAGLSGEGLGGKDVSILVRWWEGETGRRIAGT